jgi:uncharacterized OB-fold protein
MQKPIPLPDAQSAPYWESAGRGVFVGRRCVACSKLTTPSTLMCPHCRSRDFTWSNLNGTGTISTFCVMHSAFVAGFTPPYVAAVIELSDQAGLFTTANIVDCAVSDVKIGKAVEVTFEVRDGVTVPQFRLVPEQPDATV